MDSFLWTLSNVWMRDMSQSTFRKLALCIPVPVGFIKNRRFAFTRKWKEEQPLKRLTSLYSCFMQIANNAHNNM
jgi:hypothetical protein